MRKTLINFTLIITIILGFYFSFLIVFPKGRQILVSNNQIYIGKRIYLDPGHGGKDNGASYAGVLEDEINLQITTLLFEYLLQKGAMVEITRVGDYDLASLYSKTRKRDDFNKRIKYIREFSPDILISIHVNSFKDESVNGSQAFYQVGDEAGKRFALLMQDELNRLNSTSKKPKPVDFVLFTHTTIPSVLIECGFISNSSDRKKLLTSGYQEKLVQTIEQGIYNYFFSL